MASTPAESRSHLSLVPDADGQAPLPSRRGPRRDTTAIYTLRVELEDVEPAIWRTFTVPSDTMLDALHPVLQTVMGWTDSHLHGFVSGEEQRAPGSERFEVRSEHAEPLGWGPPGYAAQAYEDEVRVDEVMADVGDKLFYSYDFGDGWEHLVTLEGVRESAGETASGTAAVCLDGTRACPPEDCGGAFSYVEMLHILATPEHPLGGNTRSWLSGQFGSREFDAEAFDPVAVSAELRLQAEVQNHMPDGGTPLAVLLKRAPRQHLPELFEWLPAAGLSADPEMTAEDVDRATLHLRWLLRAIGPDGLTLTAAGFLPPALVAQGLAEFGWTERWRGRSNRESDHHEFGVLRDAAREMGLTRKLKGKLLRTKIGNSVAEDPAALLRHVTSRLPLGRERFEKESGLLLLLAIAAGKNEDERAPILAKAIAVLGWRFQGEPEVLSDRAADWLAEDTKRLLLAIRVLGDSFATLAEPEIEGWARDFARMALRGQHSG